MLASKSDRFQLYPKKQKWKAGGLGGGVEVGDPTASVVGVAVLVGDMWNVEEKPGTQVNFFW